MLTADMTLVAHMVLLCSRMHSCGYSIDSLASPAIIISCVDLRMVVL